MLMLIKPHYNMNKNFIREYNVDTQELLYKPFKTRSNFIVDGNIGDTRHFPAAIKEWKNSVYSFNKNSYKNIASKDNMVNELIKSYFYFSNIKNKPRSRRMRSMQRKFTSKKIFISKPEIKQTNDKVIVTLFTFNREKQFLLKKLFYYNRRRVILDLWRKNNNLVPFAEQYKKLDYLLVSDDYNNKITKPTINNITKNIIKQNKELIDQFNSNLISRKDKISLYYKIYNKVSRNVYKSSIFDNRINKDKNKFYFLINSTKVNRFKRKRIKTFKKVLQSTRKVWYMRKKMKRLISSPIKLTRKQKGIANKQIIPYSGIKFKNEMNFLSFKLLMKDKKLAYARKLFYFYFLKYMLSMFNIKVFAFKNTNYPSNNKMNNIIHSSELLNIENKIKKNRKGRRNKKVKFVYDIEKNALPLFKSPLSMESTGNQIKLCFYRLNKNINSIMKVKTERTNKFTSKIVNWSKPVIININTLQKKNKVDNLDYILSNINFVISQFLNKILIKSKVTDKERKLYIIFQKYCKKYYKNFVAIMEKKQVLFSKYYTKLMINRFKFNQLLPNLKLLISKIYNKKTELNLINLKYSHLNTDIYSNTIALKLRKRINVLKVIRKALKLAKKPEGYKDKSKLNIDYDLNKLSYLGIYKSLKFNNLDKNNQIYDMSLQDVLNKVYPRPVTISTNNTLKTIKRWNSIKVINSKVKNVLNMIKYKTLSGIRIEAAGRITKRYTASRAIFKFRYKGSLRNIDYSKILEQRRNSLSNIVLRNQVKANSQYSVNSSKRRVGAFGIKGWISGY